MDKDSLPLCGTFDQLCWLAKACKNPCLDGLWLYVYGVTVSEGRFIMTTVTSTHATPEQKRCFVFLGLVRPLGPSATLRALAHEACPCAHTKTRVDRAYRFCFFCCGDERHLIFERAALSANLASLRSEYFNRCWARFSYRMMLLAHHGYMGKSITTITSLGFKQLANSSRPCRGPIAEHGKQSAP